MSVVGKIDLFEGSKQGCTYPTMVELLLGLSNRGVIPLKMVHFWLFLYQIYDSTLNRKNFTQFSRPKIANFFNLKQVNFRMTLVIYGG